MSPAQAHWCGPCRHFTPKLVEKYNEHVAAGRPFEVVFLSWDEDLAAFDKYYAEMPWKKADYGEKARNQFLSRFFGVRGIPTLLLFDEFGQLITTNGREAVSDLSFEDWKNFEGIKRQEALDLEKQVAALPERIIHEAHSHVLTKTKCPYAHGQFGCDICGEGGATWSYHCDECNFDAHPHCVTGNCKVVEDDEHVLSVKLGDVEVSVTGEGSSAKSTEMVCDGESCSVRSIDGTSVLAHE